MSTIRYLVAKYIPDLRRMEPRNIGVIVWSPESVAARFLAEKEERPGEVDGRALPAMISSGSAYRQWLRYWRNQINSLSITPVGGRDVIPRDSEGFLSALQTSSRGNFILSDGGEILDRVAADELSLVADYLYAQLVDTSAGDEPRDLSLDDLCDQLISEARLKSDQNFHSKFPVDCLVKGSAQETFEFSHAYKNGVVQRLYQRVPFAKRRVLLRRTIDASAWMFEQVVNNRIIQAEQGAALVLITPEQAGDSDILRSVDVLKTVTRVLNVADRDDVLRELQQLPGLIAHQ